MPLENRLSNDSTGHRSPPISNAGLMPSLRAYWIALAAQPPSERLFAVARSAAVIVLAAIPVFILTYRGAVNPALQTSDPLVVPVAWPAGRIIWTVVIALLPLFIVSIGFYAWRRLCPLAFFGRLSEWLEWPDRRGTPNAGLRRKRVSKWVAANYPVITSSFLILMLAARILLINSNAVALAV